MAMTKCKECGKEISTKAAACPACGAKIVRTSGCAMVAAVAVGGVFLIVMLSQCVRPSDTRSADTPPTAAVPQRTGQELDVMLAEAAKLPTEGGQRAKGLQAVIAAGAGTQQAESARAQLATLVADALKEAEARGKWSYHESKDELTGKPIKAATIASENALNFGFPYEGEQHGTLVLRHHPQHGRDVYFTIDEGQILCSSYSDCSIKIAFDDGQPYTIQGNEPADNSTTRVFLPGYSTLVGRMAKAKQMRISFNAYQQGQPVLIFDVRGLDTEKLK